MGGLLVDLGGLLVDLGGLLVDLGILLGHHFVQFHHLCVASFYHGIVFVLVVHLLTDIGTHGSQTEPVENVHHVGIVLVIGSFEANNLLCSLVPFRLVEDAQHLVQLVVDFAVQQRYLHDDAVVYQTVDEGVGVAMLHFLAVIVHSLMPHIDHGLVDVADAVPQEVDCHHRDGKSLVVAFLLHVFLGVVLQGKVAAETQGLRVQPCLLQFDENQVRVAVVFPYPCGKVDTEHGNVVARHVGVFVAAHFHTHHFLLQQGGEYGLGNALILHQEFEHCVINGVGYGIYHVCSSDVLLFLEQSYAFYLREQVFSCHFCFLAKKITLLPLS